MSSSAKAPAEEGIEALRRIMCPALTLWDETPVSEKSTLPNAAGQFHPRAQAAWVKSLSAREGPEKQDGRRRHFAAAAR